MFMRPTQYAPQFTYNRGLGDITPATTTAPPATTDAPWYKKLLDAAPQIAAARTQLKLVQAQIKAQERGLDPSASALRVQTGVDPETRKLLVVGGVGAAALAAMFLLRR